LVDGQPFPRIDLEPLAEEGFFEPDDAGVLVTRGTASARSFRYQKQMYVFGMLLRDAPWYDVSIRLVPRAALLARLSHWSEQEGISTRNGSLGHLSTSHLSASQAADIEGLPAGDCDKNWSIVHDAAARTIQTSPRGRDVESCLLLLSAKPRPPREGMFALALALGSSARNRAP
jgi:hypothetical protein